MNDVLEVLRIVVVSSMVLGALPLLLLYVLRRLDAQRKRMDELQERVDQLEAALQSSAMSIRDNR